MYFTPTEVLNDMDKSFKTLGPGEVISNKLTLAIQAVSNKRHYISSISLTGTAGTGGNEKLSITKGEQIAWEESFTIGQDKIRQFQAIPIVSNFNEPITLEISATNLTAGKLYVVYYTK